MILDSSCHVSRYAMSFHAMSYDAHVVCMLMLLILGTATGARRRPEVVHGIRMDALAFKTDVQPNYERFSEIYGRWN